MDSHSDFESDHNFRSGRSLYDSHSDFESDHDFGSLKRSLFRKNRSLENELDRLCEGLFKEDPFEDSMFSFRPKLRQDSNRNIPRDTPKECIIEDSTGRRKFQAKLNMSDFDPDSIKIIVSETNEATVKANREIRRPGQSTITEMNRSFQLPKQVDPDKLTSKLSGDGILVLEALLPPDYQHVQAVQARTRRDLDGPEVPKYYVNTDGQREMVLLLSVGTGFDPDDMQVDVDGTSLSIKAFRANDLGPTTKRISFSRTYELTEAIDADSVRALLTDQGKLRISANVLDQHVCLVPNCCSPNGIVS